MILVFKTKATSLLAGNCCRTESFSCALAFRSTSFVSAVSHAGSRWKGERPADAESRRERVTESRKNLTTVEEKNLRPGDSGNGHP